jgi:UDP-GlcNAc3NAcA epimerase
MELVELGWNRLVPPLEAYKVSQGIRDALQCGPGQAAPAGLYGAGRAGSTIVTLLQQSN